jgi:hypothetical protein
MSYWRQPQYWPNLIFAWFVMMVFFTGLLAIIGSEEMTVLQSLSAIIAIQVLSIIAAHYHARRYKKVPVSPEAIVVDRSGGDANSTQPPAIAVGIPFKGRHKPDSEQKNAAPDVDMTRTGDKNGDVTRTGT